MDDIEEVKEKPLGIKLQEEKPEPKKLEDILQRYGDSQKEMMDIIINLFVRLEAIEKKLSNPLLVKLTE